MAANNGLFQIPEDLFNFDGPNGENEVLTGLKKVNYITLQFPIASLDPKPSPVKQLFSESNVSTHTTDLTDEPEKQDQE